MSSLLSHLTGHGKHHSAESSSSSSTTTSSHLPSSYGSSSSASYASSSSSTSGSSGLNSALHGQSTHYNQLEQSQLHNNSAATIAGGAAATRTSRAGLANDEMSSSSSAARMDTGIAGSSSYSNDSAMTRSEEQLLVGKEKVELGTAGLRKYVTTEHVATAVPIVRERVVVERQPIDASNIDAAMRGADIKEAEYEVDITEERAVAKKQTVPIERVQMKKVAEQSQQYVEADLRKEHIDVIDNTNTSASSASGQLRGEKTLDAAPGMDTTSTSSTRQTNTNARAY